MSLYYIVGGVAAALGITLIRGSGGRPETRNKAGNLNRTVRQAESLSTAQRKYPIVSIAHGENACDAVRRIHGIRQHISQIPILPLADCDCTQCNCKYVHHEDRRGPLRERRSFSASTADLQDRRRSAGRRRSDGQRRRAYLYREPQLVRR